MNRPLQIQTPVPLIAASEAVPVHRGLMMSGSSSKAPALHPKMEDSPSPTLLRFLCSRGHSSIVFRRVLKLFPGRSPNDVQICARRWLLTFLFVALASTAAWTVRAATDPSSAPTTPPLQPRSGRRSQRRRSLYRRHQGHRPHHPVSRLGRLPLQLRLRQRLALPSLNATTSTGQFVSPKASTPPNTAATAPGGLPPVASVGAFQSFRAPGI